MNDIARWLYILGALLAVAGPAVAAFRTAGRAKRAQSYKGTFDDFNAAMSTGSVRRKAQADAWWAFAEFTAVGFGVALSAVASLLLIP